SDLVWQCPLSIKFLASMMPDVERGDGTDDFGSLNFGEVQLSPVDSVHNLGVHFDSELNFKDHINSL
ncbi:hypothetical protein Hamer_G012949, partial [Homarus americanus]